jgi:hypothetical protein
MSFYSLEMRERRVQSLLIWEKIFFLLYMRKCVFLHFNTSIQHCFICRYSDSTVFEDAGTKPLGRNLGRNPAKVWRLFLLAMLSHLYSFALRFILLQTHATSYSFYNAFLYAVKEKGRKPDKKPPTPPSLWFKKSTQKPQVWELKRLCPETSKKLYVHEFGFWTTATFGIGSQTL